MAGFMLEELKGSRPDLNLHIVTAGTHTIDGQPMGMRTRAALQGIPELSDAVFTSHRSRQVHERDFALAELVVVMEADHVRFVRRLFPDAAARTASMRRLCEDLPPGPEQLVDRVAGLKLADTELNDADDVTDPAGREAEIYDACVAELWGLSQRLITIL